MAQPQKRASERVTKRRNLLASWDALEPCHEKQAALDELAGWFNGEGGRRPTSRDRRLIENLIANMKKLLEQLAAIPTETRRDIAKRIKLRFRYWAELNAQLRGKERSGVSAAAEWVNELAEKGLLDRLRRCACGKWYGAHRGRQKSCSARCRQKRYESTEAAKMLRRERQRRHYERWHNK